MKKIHSKMKAIEWLHFSHCRDFSRRSKAANSAVRPIWLKYKLFQAFMVVWVTCKNEADPIKNESARVLIRLYIDFSDAQGQLTPQSVMESGRNSSTSKLLWLSLLLARMKKIQSKIKALTTFIPL